MDDNLDSLTTPLLGDSDEPALSLEIISKTSISEEKHDNDENSALIELTENEPEQILEDVALPSTDDLTFSHSALEASSAPPLQLLDSDSKTMDDDSVFGGELHEMPEQILAESVKPVENDELPLNIEDENDEIPSNIEGENDEIPSNIEGENDGIPSNIEDENDEISSNIEDENGGIPSNIGDGIDEIPPNIEDENDVIPSNIEDELRQFEGSEDENSLQREGAEGIDNLVDALCDSESSRPGNDTDDKIDPEESLFGETNKTDEDIQELDVSMQKGDSTLESSTSDAFEQIDLNSMEKDKSLNTDDCDVLSDDRTQTTTAIPQSKETQNVETEDRETSESVMEVEADDEQSTVVVEKSKSVEVQLAESAEKDSNSQNAADIEDVEMSSIENQTEPSDKQNANDPLISQTIQNDDNLEELATNSDSEEAGVVDRVKSTLNKDVDEDVEMIENTQDKSVPVTADESSNNGEKEVENVAIEHGDKGIENLMIEQSVEQLVESSNTEVVDAPILTTDNDDDSQEQRPRSRTRLSRKGDTDNSAIKIIEKRLSRRGISKSPVDIGSENNKKKDVSTPQPSRSRRRFKNLDGSSSPTRSTPDNSIARSKSGDEADDIENFELKELQIKELSGDLADEKCSRCRKMKPCKYKFMRNGEIRYLCDLKCVSGFRTTSKETYTLIARKIVISLVFEARHQCERCKQIKSCRYRFKDPASGGFAYVCDVKCYDLFVGKNVEKYFRRRKTYLVQEEDSSEAEQKCVHCAEVKMCKYNFKDDDDSIYYICHDDCFNLLAKEENDRFKLKRRSVRVRDLSAPAISMSSATTEPKIVARSEQEAEAARLDREASFLRRCAQCFLIIGSTRHMLEWETVNFCTDICLEKYQQVIGAACTTCNSKVPASSLGKYCVRFGFEIRQFCCAACLETFKKSLKVCSFCQKDVSLDKDGFLAPVGDKSQFKDFCSQNCMKKYEEMLNPRKKQNTANCAVCNIDKLVRVEILLDNRDYEFCSNPCFSAFKFVNNICPDQCMMCLKFFERKSTDSYTLYESGAAKLYCDKICMNIYIILNRKIVACQWCKVKKYNFDMIQKQNAGQIAMLCSVNCLRQYSMPGNAALVVRLQKICDQCHSNCTPQYNLSMSDATIRNFCTYQCVMAFQGSFNRGSGDLGNKGVKASNKTPYPIGLPKKTTKIDKGTPVQINQPSTPDELHQPAISGNLIEEHDTSIDVASKRRGRPRKMISPQDIVIEQPLVVAQPVGKRTAVSQRISAPQSRISVPPQSRISVPQPPLLQPEPISTASCHTQTTKTGKKSIGVNTTGILPPKTQLITIPQVQPALANKQTMCKPSAEMLARLSRRPTCTVDCQTDESLERKFLIPVPVPIYVPQPMYMYSAPFPVPVPIPIPIPVPIFIPTTRNSSEGIFKEIKKIQDKMPADPFEAELLMMAELVAGEKKDNESDSEPEEEQEETTVVEYAPEIETTSNFGEDVLQMALKMATEYDEPAVDLESAMQASTITPQVEDVIDEDIHNQHMILIDSHRQLIGGVRNPRKRTISPNSGMPRNNRMSTTPPQKRHRHQQQIISPSNESIRSSVEPVEKPDANMCLKFTFGVNAWKQWVMTKNSDLEKSTIRRKPFKSELLQLTADELNYSLCLFVKEVRKPNGSEYAPDTIYYLVLGIQQYLYENGRIDNIFTDPYYERFTDCLDEVAKRFSVLYNDSQYIVTRVEEEHLWECKQLGAHSPHVLLSTLMFFNTKHFNLTTVDEHMQLSFSHIMKHWKRSPPGTKTQGSRNVLLRFYPPQTGPDANPRKKKVYEQQENENDPLRCPVKLYEFYLSKCPESVKTRSDVFYLQPERSCVPDSPVWYSTQPLSREALIKMLHRVKMVKEINIALLTS